MLRQSAFGNESPAPPTPEAFDAGGSILIKGLSPGDNAEIYNLAGMLVFRGKAAAGEMRINVPRGVYIVAVGEKRMKIAIN